MTRRFRFGLSLSLFLANLLAGSHAFSPPVILPTTRPSLAVVRHSAATTTTINDDNDGDDIINDTNNDNETKNSPNYSTREAEIAVMEELSRLGADKIATMNVAERTKRAFLAEAVEDRIFVLQEQLEMLVGNGPTRMAQADRDTAVALARQTKVLQGQYQALVRGEPSALLGSLEAVTSTTSNATRNDDDETKELS